MTAKQLSDKPRRHKAQRLLNEIGDNYGCTIPIERFSLIAELLSETLECKVIYDAYRHNFAIYPTQHKDAFLFHTLPEEYQRDPAEIKADLDALADNPEVPSVQKFTINDDNDTNNKKEEVNND